jgi:hypothetical protein
MMTARERVLSLINAAWTTQVIAVACELRVVDLMAATGSTAARLAAVSGADEVAVHRLLRALVTLELCVEHSDGHFALTEGGELLRSGGDDSLGDWARLSGTQIWDNWRELAHSVRTGESARRRLRSVDDFSYLDRDPANALNFNGAMVNLTRPVAEAAARELDWSGVSLAVDVGGGAGELIATVLGRHGHMRGVVLDLDHAAGCARAHLEQRGVADRCDVVSGSFFDSVPGGADAYLLKSVLHNWDDRQAIVILGRCAAALKQGGRVMLFERLMAERLVPAPEDREVARSDLNMLVGCGGRERTRAEFAELFAAAGMQLESSRPLVGGFHALTGTLSIPA